MCNLIGIFTGLFVEIIGCEIVLYKILIGGRIVLDFFFYGPRGRVNKWLFKKN